MPIQGLEDILAVLGSDIPTPFQQVISTFREIDRTFSALQKSSELFVWDGDEVPDDKATWIAAYFDRLSQSSTEYREFALQEIRAAGREARASLDVQVLQTTFRNYDAARDTFDRLLKSTETLLERGLVFPTNSALQNTIEQEISDVRKTVEGLDATVASGRETFDKAFASLELLMGSESALESVVHVLADHSAHTSASTNILALWEELTELEEISTETYNIARGLLGDAYVIWDLDGTTARDRRNILERLQDSHKTLCNQIVPTARLCQDIKEAQLRMTYNPPLVVGPDGRVWSVYDLRLAMPAYRVTQKVNQIYAKAVQFETSKLANLRLRGM